MKLFRIFISILAVAFVSVIANLRFAKADDAPPPEHITLTIRSAAATAFSGDVNLPDQSAADILVASTNGGASIAVSPRSVLGVLASLQASSASFQITDLSYSNSFNSFLINCIAVPAGSSAPDCYNWNVAINGDYPQVGVDRQRLNSGDVVYLFFGSPHQTTLSANSVVVGEPFMATAQQYDLPSGDYKPLPGVTLGVGTANSDFTFTEIATSTADLSGQAVFTLNATGTLAVGIKEDFYFPFVSITITDTASVPPSIPQSGGGWGGVSHAVFNIPNALAFISGKQNADGSFDSPFSTDWTAIAFSAAESGAAKTKLFSYLLNTKPDLSSITDYERHAMALEALGINPYFGTPINCITAITGAFDGTQIGTPADNDDIFALLPLEHAGFTSDDFIIQKVTAFVLSAQHPDGSWDGNPDMTAAAIQALNPLFDISGVNNGLSRAASYLAFTQMPNGGWGNIDSTSWVQTAINGMIEARTKGFETQSAWTSSLGLFSTDALANAQQPDGGVQSANRVWSTSYAVVAASGKSWPTILNSFPRQGYLNAGGVGAHGEALGATNSAASILTPPVASTTPDAATSTQPIVIIAPIIKMPTKVLTDASKPKPKIKTGKPGIKKQIAAQTPAVLGEATKSPAMPVFQEQDSAVAGVNRTGFFGHVWKVITFFFRQLFILIS